MIKIFGEKNIQLIKEELERYKIAVGELSQQLKKDHNISFMRIGDNMSINKYQVSYYLKNPADASLTEILNIYKKIKGVINPHYRESGIKYIIHPITITPKNAPKFTLNIKDVIHFFDLKKEECISIKKATDWQREHCINLDILHYVQ